ncbi:type II secretion system F family protein [Pseudomonas sp. NW5]|uniref:type II secretion system F family protein n=1 Tax=Pseudomonas sp. NW5 TaxID=2934934 RepID=UPI0020221B94|nr:type II secretion system F family protein [Pseudomonas sp. NW5]MCL7462317.1 type II secretion system F family protein [Pseudomonas sp. NW5]
MNTALLAWSLAVLLLLAGLLLLRRGLRQAVSERIMERLGALRVSVLERRSWAWLERALLRAGYQSSPQQLSMMLMCWVLATLLALLLGGWPALLLMLILPPLLLRGFVALRYQRRLRRMIEQLPQFLDHVIRSLKSGRTLGDAMLMAMQNAPNPLGDALGRTQRNIERGMPLSEALDDVAELYEREEFRILALGVRVNQRYGGNATELLDNLISMIRDRDRGARQLRAMTGETRVSGLILALLPVSLAAYIFVTNPAFFMGMWTDPMGRIMLLMAFVFQALGSFIMWRMLRSIG